MLGFLKKLFSGGASFRSTLACHPEIGPCITAMGAGDVRPALSMFGASRDPELRYRLVQATAQHFGPKDTRQMLLDAWVDNTPEDPFARLVRARFRVESAPTWYPNDPEDVAEKARAANTEAAEFAVEEYGRVRKKDARDPVPWALMLDLPLIYDLEDKQRLHAQVEQLRPLFFSAQLALHHALSAMWYGSHEEALDFARDVAGRAPAGSDLKVLVVASQLSACVYEKFNGGDERAAYQSMIADAERHAEVKQALEQSLWSSGYKPGHWALWARHTAAAWFNESGDKERARAELAQVGDSFDENARPWNRDAAGYAAIRNDLGL